jgi:hypothetical protein
LSERSRRKCPTQNIAAIAKLNANPEDSSKNHTLCIFQDQQEKVARLIVVFQIYSANWGDSYPYIRTVSELESCLLLNEIDH